MELNITVGAVVIPEGAETDADTVTVPNVIGLAGTNEAAPTLAVPLLTVKVPEAAPVVPEYS